MAKCLPRHEDEYRKLRRIVEDIRPELLGTSHACLDDETISHKVFSWSNMTVDVISDGVLLLMEGEIQTRDRPQDLSQQIEGVKSRGAWGEAKPCKVVETHKHGEQHHVHFKCAPFMMTPEPIFEQLIRIADPWKGKL